MTDKAYVLAAIGCSGEIAEVFVNGFIRQGVKVRLLARDAGKVSARYPQAEVIRGSMMRSSDVVPVLQGVDAAFLITPMGVRNDKSSEVAAARAVIDAARSANLKHLIYVSVLHADQASELSLIDAKHDVESLLAASGIPWTSLRCGSYMEDVFDVRVRQLAKGRFMFPVIKERRFTYTSQQDISRFVAQELLPRGEALNRGFNFVSPGTYSIHEVEQLLGKAQGKPVKASGKAAFYYLIRLLQPFFHWRGHRLSTIIPLVVYFNRYGYTDDGQSVATLFPEFRTTTLEEHLQRLLARDAKPDI